MDNPWKHIDLDDYEKHMSLQSVGQLQMLDDIMRHQFEAYPADTVMILGVAGGNGLEHIRPDKYTKVFGVDINEDYLKTVDERFGYLSGVLELIKVDLVSEYGRLPHADIVIADLLIEYIGYEAFVNVINAVTPQYVSCVIQINTGTEHWVSESPYLHAFDRLDEVHCQMEESELTAVMAKAGYSLMTKESCGLPNGKALIRLDYGMLE